MQRYDIEEIGRNYITCYDMVEASDGEYVRYDDVVAKLAAAARLAEELDNMATQHGCVCGHPACTRCGDTRRSTAALANYKEQTQ